MPITFSVGPPPTPLTARTITEWRKLDAFLSLLVGNGRGVVNSPMSGGAWFARSLGGDAAYAFGGRAAGITAQELARACARFGAAPCASERLHEQSVALFGEGGRLTRAEIRSEMAQSFRRRPCVQQALDLSELARLRGE